MNAVFENRTEAGRLLAAKLTDYTNRPDVIVLALPRGGVPVASEIAQQLNLPLDVCLVRKLGVPGRKELAMGAIASRGVRIINHEVVDWLHLSPDVIEQVAQNEQQELERRDLLYRQNRPLPEIRDRTIILVDDGIATGATLKAAIATLQQQQPKAIVVAVPLAPPTTCQTLTTEVERVVCLRTPDPLHSISLWYQDFSQTTDEEVQQLLALASQPRVTVPQ